MGFAFFHIDVNRFFLLLIATSFVPVAVKSQDISYDLKYGAEAAIQIKRLIGIYDDTALTNYVSEIGERLVFELGPQPFNYRFFILDSDEPNAFALPGGYVYVTRGLLPIVETEDELACVIGHEIIHSFKRHSIKQMKKSILPGILKLPGNIISGVMGEAMGNLLNAPISLGTDAWMARYSRKHEREADRLGMEIAAKAGYNPAQLAPILSNLSTLTTFKSGKKEEKSYLIDHPYTPERVEYIHKEVSKLSVTQRDKICADSIFPDQLDGLIIGQNPEQGLFNENDFIHPEMNIFVAFPDKWKVAITPVTVGAIEEKREGVVLMRVDARHHDPEEAANAFLNLIDSNDTQILVNDSVTIHQNQAHIVALKIPSIDYSLFVQNVWVKVDTTLYNLVGYGLEKHMDAIQKAIMSFREAQQKDLNELTFTTIKVILTDGEKPVEEILDEYGTKDYLELVNIINNFDNNPSIARKKKLKVIVKHPVNQ